MKNLGSLVIVIVLVGIAFGVWGTLAGDHWSPRNYVPRPGDCIVYPQGDPLYDEHYAKNVNNPNCDAQIDQSQSRLIDAQTRAINTQITQGNIMLYGFLVVLVLIIGFFAWAVSQNNGPR